MVDRAHVDAMYAKFQEDDDGSEELTWYRDRAKRLMAYFEQAFKEDMDLIEFHQKRIHKTDKKRKKSNLKYADRIYDVHRDMLRKKEELGKEVDAPSEPYIIETQLFCQVPPALRHPAAVHPANWCTSLGFGKPDGPQFEKPGTSYHFVNGEYVGADEQPKPK